MRKASNEGDKGRKEDKEMREASDMLCKDTKRPHFTEGIS